MVYVNSKNEELLQFGTTSFAKQATVISRPIYHETSYKNRMNQDDNYNFVVNHKTRTLIWKIGRPYHKTISHCRAKLMYMIRVTKRHGHHVTGLPYSETMIPGDT